MENSCMYLARASEFTLSTNAPSGTQPKGCKYSVHLAKPEKYMSLKKLSLALATVSCLLLASCATDNKPQTLTYFDGGEEVLFTNAKNAIASKNYTTAEELLTQLKLQFPFGQERYNAELLQIQTAYATQNYEAVLTRTGSLLATNSPLLQEKGDYVLVHRAMASFESNRSFFQKLFNLDVKDNDLNNTIQAIGDLKTLVQNFPASPYAPFAAEMSNYLTDLVAAHYVDVAQHYIKFDNPLAAYKRANTVVLNYPDSPYAPQALKVLEQAATLSKFDYTAEIAKLQETIDKAGTRPLIKTAPVMPQLDPLTYNQKPVESKAEVSTEAPAAAAPATNTATKASTTTKTSTSNTSSKTPAKSTATKK